MTWAMFAMIGAIGFGAYWMLARLPLAALAPATVFALGPFAADWQSLAANTENLTAHILIVLIVGPVTAAFVYRLIAALVPEMTAQRRKSVRIATGLTGLATSLGITAPFGQ
jgi:hypothetical protein